jgi:hypothetical protein
MKAALTQCAESHWLPLAPEVVDFLLEKEYTEMLCDFDEGRFLKTLSDEDVVRVITSEPHRVDLALRFCWWAACFVLGL